MLKEVIFGEMPFEKFTTEYLDKKPLLLKGVSPLYQSFNVKSIDKFLMAAEGSLHQFVRILIDGCDVAMPANPIFSMEMQKKFIDKKFHQGATVKVDELGTRHPIICKICRAFEMMFGGESYAVAFLTPEKKKGFGVHFDPVPAFIVQLEGKKSWKIYPEFVQSPTKIMVRPLDGVTLPLPEMEVTLEPGDMLYIPAGFPHEATCSDTHSLHVTFGLNVHRPIDIFSYALTLLAGNNVSLRQPIYPNAPDFSKRLGDSLQLACRLLSDVDAYKLNDSFENAWNANRHEAQTTGLHNSAKGCQATIESTVSCVPFKPVKIEVQGKSLVIYPSSSRFGKSLFTQVAHIEMPLIAEIEVRELLSAKAPVKVKNITGKLNVESKLLLARELVKYGLLEIVDV